MIHTFEIATNDDWPQLLALEIACFEPVDRLSGREFRALLNKVTARVFVKREMGTIVATAIILFRRNSKIARLYSLAVAPSHQKKGIARALLYFLEETLQDRCNEIRLEVRKDNSNAIRLYNQLGYHIFAESHHFYGGGEGAFRMKKIIGLNNMESK